MSAEPVTSVLDFAEKGGNGERVRRLQAEAADLARRHVEDFEMMVRVTARVAREVASGGSAYPPGVRDLARRLGEEMDLRADAMEAILIRS